MERRVVVLGVTAAVVAAGGVGTMLARGGTASSGCDLGVAYERLAQVEDGTFVAFFRVTNAGRARCDVRQFPELSFAHEGKPVAVAVRSNGSDAGLRAVPARGEAAFQLRWSSPGGCRRQVLVDAITVRVSDAVAPVTVDGTPDGTRGSNLAVLCGGAATVSDIRPVR